MKNFVRFFCLTAAFVLIASATDRCSAQIAGPGISPFGGFPIRAAQAAPNSNWYPYVIARGEDRQRIENMPIEMRPNRPLHFYGNTVRRNRR